MKCTKLKIINIGKVADMTVPIDKPLLLFYGEIRQGKTTILNAVRWVCGGEFPSDIIQHGKDEGSITLEFDGGVISRSWYRGKGEDKSIKARPVTFIRDGKPVSSPVSEIKRFLNPFLINQDHLRNMTETERKQYFAELFAVDTTELDKEWVNNDREARSLRVKIGGYGDIDTTKYERVDVAAEQAKLVEIRAVHNKAVEDINAENRKIIEHNATFDQGTQKLAEAKLLVEDLETRLATAREQKSKIKKWMTDHPRQVEKVLPTVPDTAALEKAISDAGATNVRAEQYQKNLERAKAKQADEDQVKKYETRQRAIKDEKRAKLKTVSESCGIPNLAFDEEGNFTYEGCQAGMLSTSQIMKLSSELSALYPSGFGLELLDRAESLGKSIFDFVERAKNEKKTILATIVGERPAKVPPEIGVFVVSDGKLDEAPE
jgi:DNA repair ATPase RecN